MPIKKIAVVLFSPDESTAILTYAGGYAKKVNAKLCIIITNCENKKQSTAFNVRQKLLLIEKVHTIIKAQSILYEIIITSTNAPENLVKLLMEHTFESIIVNANSFELSHVLNKLNGLPIILVKPPNTEIETISSGLLVSNS